LVFLAPYDADHASFNQAFQSGGGASNVTAFEDETNLGDAAFWYYDDGGDHVRVKYKQVELLLTSDLCHSPTTSTCDSSDNTKGTALAGADREPR
jgi:hypothetical protein